MLVPNLLSIYFWDHPSFCSNRENIDSWEIVDCSGSFLTSSGNLVDWSGSCYQIYNRSNNFHMERFVNLTTIGGSWYFDRALVEGVTKRSRLINCHFTTISSQISAIYINIFHKTEVQTVILRCWTVLYINWLKSYDKNEKHAKTQKTQKSPKTVHKNFFFYKIALKRKWKKLHFV